MNTAIVINTILGSNRWLGSICGFDPVKELIKKLERIVKKEDLFVVVNDKISREIGQRFSGFRKIQIHDLTTKNVFRELFNALTPYEDIIYLFADTPLIDIEITEKMITLHRDEYAEYTCSEGFPAGITPEIVKCELFPKLAALLENDNSEIARDSIFYGLSKEINSFDIETYFSPEDLKIKRIELSTTLKRNALIVERVIEKKGFSCSFEQFHSLIHEQPAVLRTVPAYVEMEITSMLNAPCIYSPLPFLKRDTGTMNYETFKSILDKIRAFSEKFYVAFSFLGEPLLHGDIKKFIEYAISDNNIHLILETNGTLFTPAFSDYIRELHADNLSIIFEVDAALDETYRSIHRGDLSKVERNIRYLLSKISRNIYVQMIRVSENEQEMLNFFDLWEKEGAKVIIQKYNSYLGLLTDLSKYDLRPLERMCCWHLLRDLVVFQNGDVPRCKQDMNGLFLLGNLQHEEISTVWEKGEPFYLQHCAEKYDEYCSKCDEYYTFNF